MGVAGQAAGYGAQFGMPGMGVKGVQFNGRPLTQEEQQGKLSELDQRREAEQIKFAEARMIQAGAQRNARMAEEKQLQQQKAFEEQQIAADQQAAIRSERHRAEILDKPLQKIDPKRYLRNMTTGQRAWGIAAMMFEGIGNAFIQVSGGRPSGGGGYMELLQKAIDDDIEAQKVEIQTGEARRDNELAELERAGVRRDQRIQVAQARKWGVLAKLGENKIAELQAQGADTASAMAGLQAIQNKYTELGDAIQENERRRQQIQLAPKPPTDPLAERELVVKAMEQEARAAKAQTTLAESGETTATWQQIMQDPELQQQEAERFAQRRNTVRADNQMKEFRPRNELLRKTRNLLDLWKRLESVPPDQPVRISDLAGNDSRIYDWFTKQFPDATYLFGDDLDTYRKYVNAKLEELTRANWKTEPNGERMQSYLGKLYQGVGAEERVQLMNQLDTEVKDAYASLYESQPKDLLAWVFWNEPKRAEQRKGTRAGRIEQ